MNRTEKIAKSYLDQLDRGRVIYEPDGNNPPDFSVGGTIGAEVRRLNQQYFGAGEATGLEELSIPLWKRLKQEFRKFDKRFDGNSYWVRLRYERPLEGSGQDVANAVRKALDDFLDSEDPAPVTLDVLDNLDLKINPGSPEPGKVFRLEGYSDRDRGGFLIPIYVDNITYCIGDKSDKVEPYIQVYEDWWLILVDFVGWGLNNSEEARLQMEISDLQNFERIDIISNPEGRLLLNIETDTT